MIGLQPATFTLTLDDGEARQVRATDIVIANGGELGLGPGAPDVRLGPELHIDDGELNIIVIRARNSWDYVRTAWGFLLGRNRHNPNVRFLKARRISVEADQVLPVQADGEIIGWQSMEAQVAPRAARFIVSLNGDK